MKSIFTDHVRRKKCESNAPLYDLKSNLCKFSLYKSIHIVHLFSDSSECLQSLCMTSVDLCAMYKPWSVQKDVVITIMDEFWEQVC